MSLEQAIAYALSKDDRGAEAQQTYLPFNAP
jgi:hypothetical protein